VMSCACLVLFCGFLFVGEPSKEDAIFHVLSALCLLIVLASLLAVAKVIFLKLEEAFHCWNCRKVPLVQAPSIQQVNSIGQKLHSEIIAAHRQATVVATGTGGTGTATTTEGKNAKTKTVGNNVHSLVSAGRKAETQAQTIAAGATAAAAAGAGESAGATHFKIAAPVPADDALAEERKEQPAQRQ